MKPAFHLTMTFSEEIAPAVTLSLSTMNAAAATVLKENDVIVPWVRFGLL